MLLTSFVRNVVTHRCQNFNKSATADDSQQTAGHASWQQLQNQLVTHFTVPTLPTLWFYISRGLERYFLNVPCTSNRINRQSLNTPCGCAIWRTEMQDYHVTRTTQETHVTANSIMSALFGCEVPLATDWKYYSWFTSLRRDKRHDSVLH